MRRKNFPSFPGGATLTFAVIVKYYCKANPLRNIAAASRVAVAFL